MALYAPGNATSAASFSDAAIPAAAQTGQALGAGEVHAAASSSTATPPTSALFESLQQGSLSGYLEMLAILCFVLALLWFTLWFIKRVGGKFLTGSSPRMQIEGRLSIAPKRWIMIVRVESKRLIIGVSDQHIETLAELPELSGTLPKTSVGKATSSDEALAMTPAFHTTEVGAELADDFVSALTEATTVIKD